MLIICIFSLNLIVLWQIFKRLLQIVANFRGKMAKTQTINMEDQRAGTGAGSNWKKDNGNGLAINSES